MAGYPRVTHPSATKLTKSLPKIWQRLTPFDLHVLSTPPAFILSQDQTLILNSSTTIYLRLSCQFLSGLLLVRVLRFLFRTFVLNFLLGFILMYPVGIFRVALLFICQGSYNHFRVCFVVVLCFTSNSDILSCCFLFVNNFFIFFKIFLSTDFEVVQPLCTVDFYNSTLRHFCQQLFFYSFSTSFAIKKNL